MGHTTRFYFRAKLDFRTPAAVKMVLHRQFAQLGLGQRTQAWTVGTATEPSQPPAGTDWAGHGELREPHLFFSLPRAHCIPFGTEGPVGRSRPLFKQQADGGARLEFECEFKNYDGEIEQFLSWIAPFVRQKFGKRNRGRHRVWVGWYLPECAEQRFNVFIEPCPTPEFPGMLFGRRVCIDYRN